MLVRLQPLLLPCPTVGSYLSCNDIIKPLFSFCAFTVLPDRPLQWTTSSTRAPDDTSWRCPRRTTMRMTSFSRFIVGCRRSVGGLLCVALSRAIWILTVLGRVCLPHVVCCIV